MAVYRWLPVISGLVIVTASFVSSELQNAAHDQNTTAVPPNICTGDLSLTKGYRCQDYDVSGVS